MTWQSKAQRKPDSVKFRCRVGRIFMTEAMTITQSLQSKKISVKLPVMVRVDNMDAIFMRSNVTATSHTKHVDIRNKYVNEYVEDKIEDIVFVKSVKNDCNILTNNLGGELMISNQKNS